MKTAIYSAALVAGTAMATMVVAQTGIKAPGPINGNLAIAPSSDADLALVKSRLSAAEAKLAALDAKTQGMVGGLNQLQTRFDGHTHVLVANYGPGTHYVPLVSCKQGAGFGANVATCAESPWPGAGGNSGYFVGVQVEGLPTKTGKPVN